MKKFLQKQEKTFNKIASGEGTHESRAVTQALADVGLTGNAIQRPLDTLDKTMHAQTHETKSIKAALGHKKAAQEDDIGEQDIETLTVVVEQTPQMSNAITQDTTIVTPGEPESAAESAEVAKKSNAAEIDRASKYELIAEKAKNINNENKLELKTLITENAKLYRPDIIKLVEDALGQDVTVQEYQQDIIWGLTETYNRLDEQKITGDHIEG